MVLTASLLADVFSTLHVHFAFGTNRYHIFFYMVRKNDFGFNCERKTHTSGDLLRLFYLLDPWHRSNVIRLLARPELSFETI